MTSIPFHGVRLPFLKDLIKEAGGREKLKDYTTHQIYEEFVKPKTLELQSSYCDLLSSHPGQHGFGSKATVFISHAWQYKFVELVDALYDHFEEEGRSCLAIYVYCPCVKSLSIFDNIFSDEQVLIEVIRGQLGGYQLEIGSSSFLKMLATIDAEKSECFKKEDRRKIFEIARIVGFEKLNGIALEKLRDWVISTVENEIENISDNGKPSLSFVKTISLLQTLGRLYEMQGKYDLVESTYFQMKRMVSLLLEEEVDINGESESQCLCDLNVNV